MILQVFVTARKVGIMRLIDSAIGQSPFTLANTPNRIWSLLSPFISVATEPRNLSCCQEFCQFTFRIHQAFAQGVWDHRLVMGSWHPAIPSSLEQDFRKSVMEPERDSIFVKTKRSSNMSWNLCSSCCSFAKAHMRGRLSGNCQGAMGTSDSWNFPLGRAFTLHVFVYLSSTTRSRC